MATSRPPIPRQVALPPASWAYVERQVADGQAKSIDAYLRDLILRARRTDQFERKELEALLQEGLDSGPSIPMDDAFWAERRRRLALRRRNRKTPR